MIRESRLTTVVVKNVAVFFGKKNTISVTWNSPLLACIIRVTVVIVFKSRFEFDLTFAKPRR